MFLNEVFDQFTYGELSQISIGGQPAGVINENNYDRILPQVNLGLSTLYKRFDLKENSLVIDLVDLQYVYRLHSDYSVHNTKLASVTKYIQDTAAARFKNDIIKIKSIWTVPSDPTLLDPVQLSINDASDDYTVKTLSMTTLELPKDLVDQSVELPDSLRVPQLKVIYQADHPKLVTKLGILDPERTEVELPMTHLEALCLFVASRAHNPVGMTNEFHTGNNYAAKFEAECQRLENLSLHRDEKRQSDRLREKGFV